MNGLGNPSWEGDLEDDCIAHWRGLTLRAECMDEDVWWWAVYEDATDKQIDSSNNYDAQIASGEKAREAAEIAARRFLLPTL